MSVLSPMHQTVSTDNCVKKLPETISQYHSTKVAIDVIVQIAQPYMGKGGTRIFNYFLGGSTVN